MQPPEAGTRGDARPAVPWWARPLRRLEHQRAVRTRRVVGAPVLPPPAAELARVDDGHVDAVLAAERAADAFGDRGRLTRRRCVRPSAAGTDRRAARWGQGRRCGPCASSSPWMHSLDKPSASPHRSVDEASRGRRALRSDRTQGVGPHRSLALDSPEGRKLVQRMPSQRVDSKPVLGGLHHEYRWAA